MSEMWTEMNTPSLIFNIILIIVFWGMIFKIFYDLYKEAEREHEIDGRNLERRKKAFLQRIKEKQVLEKEVVRIRIPFRRRVNE